MERMVKMTKKDQGERGMEKKKKKKKKNPLLPPDRKPHMVANSLWQRAIWQRLETRNPFTQYKPHNDANSHWTLNRRSRSTHILLFFIFLIKLSRLAKVRKIKFSSSSSSSHHPHIEKERNNSRSKREHKDRKNKLNSRSVYQEPHWPKHETLTQGKHKVSSRWWWVDA